jgi:hypothetical protein
MPPLSQTLVGEMDNKRAIEEEEEIIIEEEEVEEEEPSDHE